MKKLAFLFAFAIIIVFTTVSCKENEPDPPAAVKRSVLIYMAANNSLNRYAKSNLTSLKNNYSQSIYNDCNLIVYYHGSASDSYPQLIKISNNENFEVVKQYDKHNSADYNTMASVIGDFKAMFPADSYGCVFWSHGTGWLPKSFTGRASKTSPFLIEPSESSDQELINHPFYQYIRRIEYPTTKAFGQDGSNWMDIEEMELGLKDNEFDFIIFDACYMGSIEVAYTLRNKSKWMLASPTEILGDGMQYNTLAKHFFNTSEAYPSMLKNIAEDFVSKYKSESTYAIYDLSKMNEFTAQYKELMTAIPDKIGNATPRNIQRFDRYSDHVVFDLVHYVSTISNQTTADRLSSMLSQIIIHKYTSPRYLGIQMEHYSGISTYIPFESYNAVTPLYKELKWWNNVLKQ